MKAAEKRGPLTDHERRTTLTAFANGSAGHTFGVDDLVDDVVYAYEAHVMPRPGGLDDQPRNFVSLFFHYSRECKHAEMKARAGQL